MKKRNVSDAVIRRLPRYYRHLNDLHSRGVERISSGTLGAKMGITASQIRQDLSCFGEFGQQGYGYNVSELRTEIGRILGVDQKHRAIMVGAGNLGHALMRNFPFNAAGVTLEAAFDIDESLVGTEAGGVPILPLTALEPFVAEHQPHLAILTMPKSEAWDISNWLIRLGIRGFWNFTNVDLTSDVEGVRFEDVHFADSLLTLSYRITQE